jgi:sugar-phosphatase
MTEIRCAAVLFDLDGVLVSSTQAVARQWRLWAQEQGIAPEEVVKIAHGRRTIEIIRLLAPHLDAEPEMRRLEAREAADTDGVEVIRGARELIHMVPADKWAVVTSGTRLLALSRLKLGGIPEPRVLVTADDVQEGKPDPAPYRRGAELLNIPVEQCVVIEDAPAGITSAHAAGMRAIAVTSTYPALQLREAEAIVKDLAAIEAHPTPGSNGDEILLRVSETAVSEPIRAR